jgi:hypothetical protein
LDALDIRWPWAALVNGVTSCIGLGTCIIEMHVHLRDGCHLGDNRGSLWREFMWIRSQRIRMPCSRPTERD